MNIQNIIDTELHSLLKKEQKRQQQGINLIASENYVPQEIREITGSVLCNKYIEGYPGSRYYSGCKVYDKIELLAIQRFQQIFKAEHVNVQPHSGSQANAAVYMALLQSGDTILSMDLYAGGHLSHGHKVNWTHQLYNIISYGVDSSTYLIDYDQIEKLALQHKPKLIIAGASAYSRRINFENFAKIAKKIGAIFMADIAHTAGLIAAGLHPSPFPYADIVTMTTHKTFRGPRGGVIMTKEKELGKKIDKMLMPGMQGGALMNHVAGKATAALLAMQPSFITYQQQVVRNAHVMAQEFINRGYTVLTDGTETHLFLIDLTPKSLNGRQVEQLLESINIFVNRNSIPFDTKPPLHPSGIRIGTPAITTIGADEHDIIFIVDMIDYAIKNYNNKKELLNTATKVKQYMKCLIKKNKFSI